MRTLPQNPLFTFIFLLFTFISADTFAQSSETDALPCGMVMGAHGAEVEAGSFEICEDDVSFQGIYILYGEIIGDNAYRGLFELFLNPDVLDSEFTNFANETLGVSGGVYLALSALAIAGWVILSPLIAYKGWSLITHFQKTGSFDFAESQGDVVKFTSYLAALLFLAFPAGMSGGSDGLRPPLMIGQVLAITGAVPAIQGGNYIYSTYLSSTNSTSTEVNLKTDFLLPSGQDVANKFIEIKMCESETRNSLMSMNAKPDSEFFKSFSFTEYFDFDHENIVGRYDNCLAYVGKAQEGDIPSSISSFTIDKNTFTTDFCGSGAAYKADSYGHEHSCGRIQYDYGQKKYSDIIEGEDSVSGDDMEDVLSDIQSSFDVESIYSLYKTTIRDELKTILSDSSLTAQERYEQIDDLALQSSSIIKSQLDENPLLGSGTNIEMQAKYMAAGAALLGGKFTGKWYDGNEYLYDSVSRDAWKAKTYLPVNYENEDIDNIFGIDTFLSEAESIASDIRSYYCAINWNAERETRRVITDFNMVADDSEDALAAAIGGRSVSYRCIRFLSEDEHGDTDFDRYITYMVDDPRANNDLVEIGGGAGYQFSTDSSLLVETQDYMTNTVGKRLYEDIRYKTLTLSSYSASVKKAISESLSGNLSAAEAESTKDLNLRGLGWGIFGGALLYNGRTRTSAAHVGKSIESLITIESGGQGLNFIEQAAFGSELNLDKLNELYTPYELDNMLTIGFSGAGDYEGPIGVKTDNVDSQEAVEKLMGYMERLLIGPLDHIKVASGMDIDRTFSSGLQQCFNEGSEQCLTGVKHPLIALSDFGNEMIDNMLILMVTHGVLKVVVDSGIAKSSDGDSKLTGDKSDNNSWWAKSKKFMSNIVDSIASVVGGLVNLLLSIVMKIMEIAYTVLDLFMPVITTLAITGLIFAYLLPMLSYIYGFMMLLLFWGGIFLITAAIPFYLFMKILNAEKEYQQGFMKMYQDLSGPYATPLFFGISAVISWSIMVVLLYAVNITFTVMSIGLDASLNGSFGLSVLFLKVFLYIVYFVAIFVLLKFCLGIMKTMPDMLREKTGMKRSNDEKYIESLGFEQYVAGQVGYQMTQTLAQMPASLANAISKGYQNGGFKSTASLQREAEQAEVTLANMKTLHEKLATQQHDDTRKEEPPVSDQEVKQASDNVSSSSEQDSTKTASADENDVQKSSLDHPGANKKNVQIKNEEGKNAPERDD